MRSSPLHDVHCHLDLYPDYGAVIRDTDARGIFTLAVTNTPSVFARCRDLLAGAKHIHAAVGLHPQLVASRSHELGLLLDLVGEVPYVGEVGLDFVDSLPDARRLQQDILARILARCSEVGGRVVSLHSRRAAAETIELVVAHRPGTPILHWYSGPTSLIDRAVAAGCYFSVNVAMLGSASGRRIVGGLPFERVLTETDGPFVQINGQPTRPVAVGDAVTDLARLWRREAAEVSAILRTNLEAAFQLSPTS